MADEPTFEALYAELEARARRLEQGNLSLEDSLRLYEEGAALVGRLRELLERAELRVRTVQERLQAEAPELQEDAETYDAGEFEDG